MFFQGKFCMPISIQTSDRNYVLSKLFIIKSVYFNRAYVYIDIVINVTLNVSFNVTDWTKKRKWKKKRKSANINKEKKNMKCSYISVHCFQSSHQSHISLQCSCLYSKERASHMCLTVMLYQQRGENWGQKKGFQIIIMVRVYIYGNKKGTYM